MSKFAELPDGTKLEFPDDTEDSVIDSTVKKHLGVSASESDWTDKAKTFGKSAVESTVPALTGITGAGAAMAVGAPLIAGSGPFAPVTALGLGLIGGMGGGHVGQVIQDKVTDYIPDEIKEAAGWGKGVREAEKAADPMIDFAGKLAPNLLAFRPGAIPDIVTASGKVIGPTAQRAFAGGISSGVETGSQLYNGEALDWRKIAMAGAFDAIAAKPTKFGEKLLFSPHASNTTQGTPDPDAAIADPTHDTLGGMTGNVQERSTNLGHVIQEIGADITALQTKKQKVPATATAYHEKLDAQIADKYKEMAQAHQDKKALDDWLANPQNPQATQTPPVPPQATAVTPPTGAAATAAPTPAGVASTATPSAVTTPPAAATTVTPPAAAVTSQPPHPAQQLADVEAHLRTLEEEAAAINRKGNSKTQEEFDRLQQIRDEYDATLTDAERLAITVHGNDVTPTPDTATTEVPVVISERSALDMSPGELVHEKFLAELSKYSNVPNSPAAQKILTERLATYDRRIAEENDLVLNGYSDGSALGWMMKERDILQGMLDGTITKDHIITPDRSNVTTPEEMNAAVMKAMDQTIRLNDMRAGLTELANNSTSGILRSVSNFLLNNPIIGKFTKLAYSKDLAFDAQVRQTREGTTAEFNPNKLTQTTYVHEAVHAATSGMMKAFAMGYTKFTPEAKVAMTRIADLNARLRADHFDYIVDNMVLHIQKTNPDMTPEQVRQQANDDVNAFLKNDRELLAYGMTMQPFMKILDDIKFFGRPSISDMYDDIAKVLGSVDPKQQSALRELLHNGEQLLRQSEGQGIFNYTKNTADLDTIDNMGSYRTPTGDIGTNAWKEFKKRFAPNMGSLAQGIKKAGLHMLSPNSFPRFFRHGHIDTVAKIVRSGDRNSERLMSRIIHGDPSSGAMDTHVKGSVLIPMSKAQGDLYGKRGLEYAFKLLTNKELTELIPGIKRAFAERFDPRTDFDVHFPNTTPKQREFLTEYYRASDLLYDADLARATKHGHPPPKKIPGYFIKNNSGRFYVDIMANGVIVGRQWVNSEKAAKDLANRYPQKIPEISASYHEREPFADYSGLIDALETTRDTLLGAPHIDPISYLEGQIKTINLKANTVGGHHKHRGALFGFGGDTGGTIHEMAQDFKEMTMAGAREYTKALRAREIASEYAFEKQRNPYVPTNVAEAGRFFLDHHLGRTANSGFAKMLDKGIADPINKSLNDIYYTLFGKSPKGDVIETAFNQTARLGYNMILTSAPVTWVSQVLATMNSMRMIAQMSNNPATGLMHGMSGIAKTMFNQYDKDAMDGLKFLAQNTDVFHKTVSHDIMTATGQNTIMGKHDNKRRVVTGEAMTEWSDSFSRIASWRVAYEILKSQGKTGPLAWKEAAKMMTENLFPMGREHLPAMYKELGFVGTAMAPLKSYTHHLASNLIADTKQVLTGKMDDKLKDTYILGMNMLAIMLQGGLLGTPFLADYEYLRQQMVKWGWINHDRLPNYTQIAQSQGKWLSNGAISAATNGMIDIGQSNRYRSIFESLGEATAINAASSMPLSFAANAATGVGTIAKDMFGNVPDPQARAAWDKVLPRGLAKGIKEDIYNKDNMVPFGKRGEALVERGPAERIAKYLGSSSMEESRARTTMNDREINKDSLLAQKQKAYDLILSQSPSDKAAGYKVVERLAKDMNVSYDEALRQVKNLRLSQLKTREDRSYTDIKGNMTTLPKARSLRDLLEYRE